MEFFALLFPVGVAAGLLLFFRSRIVWWEIALLLAVAGVVFTLSRVVLINYNTTDTEYLGSYAVEVQYDEPWDEWISQTCYRKCCCTTDSKGAETCGQEPYDCSYRQYHDAEYRKIDQLGAVYPIDKVEYEQLCRQFATTRQFVEMNRDYYTEDGNRYACHWSGVRARLAPLTRTHRYENKVQAAHSVFQFVPVSLAQKAQYQLFEYPYINDHDLQPAVLSRRPLNYLTQVRPYDELNALLGASKQVRVFVLLFENQSREAAIWQRNYWEGGNKNELVVCIGLNPQGQVSWCEPFAWEDRPLAEIKIRDLFQHQGRLDLLGAAPVVEDIILKDWHRKQFMDFAYLEIELSATQLISLYLLVIVSSLGFGTWCVLNGVNPESETPTQSRMGPLHTRRPTTWRDR
jgi:hypothetical protein